MDSVIVRYQEIALKGRNRPWFIERLVGNLVVLPLLLNIATRDTTARPEEKAGSEA